MPASVPACAGLHTRGTTLRAGIVLDGDLGCLADLLDDQETAVSLDHARDVQVASVAAILAHSGFSPVVVGQSLSVERSANRRAENEAAFRDANEGLLAKAAELGLGDQRTPYLCECEDETCIEIIRLTRAEYEDVRADPKRFVVKTGHHQPPYDKVIREDAEFTIIQKTGEEGELVAERDPRSAG